MALGNKSYESIPARKVAFLGLGVMGHPMAGHLARAGHRVTVYNRTVAKAEAWVREFGGRSAPTPRAAAEGAEFVFACVGNDDDLRSVVLDDAGAFAGMAPGAVLVDHTTASAAIARELHAAARGRGLHFVDAPVSGGQAGAQQGTLSIMVGGEAEIFQRVKPLFEVLGKNIVHVGSHGAGQVVKACNQVVISLTMEGVAEAILLARNNGVDPAKMREALMGGYANSKILEVHGQRMLEGNYKAGFKVKLHHKDMGIVVDNAHENHTPLPGAELVARQIASLMDAGEAELDSTAIMLALERLSQQ